MKVSRIYKIDNKACRVAMSKALIAEEIDGNIDGKKDHVLDNDEITLYMRQKNYMPDPKLRSSDIPQILKDFKTFLRGEPLPQSPSYHTYESAVQELQDLAKQHPDLAQFIVLGKSAEGRDLVALKISSDAKSDTSRKKGVVITGLTHAREWATMESAMKVAKDLVNGYGKDEKVKQKLDKLEIWVVPFVNPDGYVFSRNEIGWWRKNMRPITNTGCPKHPDSVDAKSWHIGVDLNRNYYDGNPDHFEIYRPKGDTPCNIQDDFSATSDYPGEETYRGPSGGSEPETKILMDLELKKPNIIGVIDLHSYGEMLLYPWGHTHDKVPNVEAYKEIGKRINNAMENRYKLMQSADLYPASGISEDIHQANGKISFTFEIGQSFFPTEKELPELTKLVSKGCAAFLDWAAEQPSPHSS